MRHFFDTSLLFYIHFIPSCLLKKIPTFFSKKQGDNYGQTPYLLLTLYNGANESNNSPLENYKVIFRRNNGANEGNISSSLDYCRVQPIEDIVSTATPGGGSKMPARHTPHKYPYFPRKKDNHSGTLSHISYLLLPNSYLISPKRFNASIALAYPCSAAFRYQFTASL